MPARRPPTDAGTIVRHPLMEMFIVAAPVVATMMSYTIAQFVDGVMVSRLGEGALSAQFNGGIIAFVPLSIMMGVFGVINTYVSQNLGAGKPERGAAYAWNGVWMGVFVWTLFLVPVALLMRPIMVELPALIGAPADWISPEVMDNQIAYARILLLGSIFTLAARAQSHFFFGMHMPMTVLIATVAGNLVNVGLNYVLIFGHFGFPALGVPGAAIGTVVGGFVEFLIPCFIFLGPKLNRLYATRAGWRPSWKHMRDIFRIGWPAGVMFGNEMICWALLMVWLIGTISVPDNEAAAIGLRYMHLSFMPAVGMSVAITAIVGKCIGMGRPDLAVKRTWLGMRVTMIYMGACAAAFVIFRKDLVGFFVSDTHSAEAAAEVLRIGGLVMICAAVFQVFDAVGITMIGALRGAGDTVVPGIATAVMSWTLLILGGWVMKTLFPELGSLGPWIAAAVYITAFAAFMLWRFLGGKWRRLKLIDRENLPETQTGDALLPSVAAMGAPSLGDLDDQGRDLLEARSGGST